jgi:hypothetical protein
MQVINADIIFYYKILGREGAPRTEKMPKVISSAFFGDGKNNGKDRICPVSALISLQCKKIR